MSERDPRSKVKGQRSKVGTLGFRLSTFDFRPSTFDFRPSNLRTFERKFRRGVTLMEVVLAATVSTILLGGTVSAIMMAARAVPDPTSERGLNYKSLNIVGQMSQELLTAESFSKTASNVITFAVPDRNSDGSPEVIEYTWNGSAGTALKRSRNGGARVTVVDEVDDFELVYFIRRVTDTGDPIENESGEMLLFQHVATSDLDSAEVNYNEWWGQYFYPALPGDTTSWTVSRVQFKAKKNVDNVDTKVQLRLPSAGNSSIPDSTYIDQGTLPWSDLTSAFQWKEVKFYSAGGLAPNSGLFLTFVNSIGRSCILQYRDVGVVLANSGLSHANPNWGNMATDQALQFRIYGTVTTTSPPQTTNTDYLTGVQIKVCPSGSSVGCVETLAQVLNEPTVTGM